MVLTQWLLRAMIETSCVDNKGNFSSCAARALYSCAVLVDGNLTRCTGPNLRAAADIKCKYYGLWGFLAEEVFRKEV